jgi:hypothetical protein
MRVELCCGRIAVAEFPGTNAQPERCTLLSTSHGRSIIGMTPGPIKHKATAGAWRAAGEIEPNPALRQSIAEIIDRQACLRDILELLQNIISELGDLIDVRGGGRGYQNGGPRFANLSPRLSLFSDHLRTVLAVKGSLRRAQQRRALDGSAPFRTTLLRRGKGSLRTAPLAGDHFAAILVSFFAATDTD